MRTSRILKAFVVLCMFADASLFYQVAIQARQQAARNARWIEAGAAPVVSEDDTRWRELAPDRSACR